MGVVYKDIVITLLKRNLDPGTKQIVWDGNDARGNPVASGIYYFRLTPDKYALTRKLVLIK
jgi:hypothetical protein